MKKIINNPDQFVDEMVEGILLAHPDQVRTPGDDRRVLVRADSPAPGRVGIVTGGGSGHLPLFKGYVGKGLCSGVAIGNVFSSPSVQQCADAAKAVDGGAGVLFLYGNYGGDVFNFDLAVDLLELDGIETRTVLGCDDVASQPKERAKDRRGVAGIFFAYKAAGAAAERGDSLEEVTRIATKVNDQTRSMGLALIPSCGACLSNMAVAPDGTVLPCQSWLTGHGLGHILRTPWNRIWRSPECCAIRTESARMKRLCQLGDTPMQEGF